MAELKALYKKDLPLGWNAQNRSVKDYYTAPEITAIGTQGYTGKPGDVIRITAVDDFMVCKVSVAIYDDEGRVIDRGEAVYGETLDEWLFAATQLHQSSGRIEIAAEDLPGNEDCIILDVTGGTETLTVQVFVPRQEEQRVMTYITAWKRGTAIPPGLLRLKT